MKFSFHYNAPVILTFSLLCAVIFTLNSITQGGLSAWISNDGYFSFSSPQDYITLFSYVLGHASFDHLLGNLTFILLIGPILEEKYGSKQLLLMICATAFITALLNILLFHDGMWGASGIVFMLVMLVSFVNVKAGKIPVTFILIFLLFIGREVYNSFADDHVSQFAHILGGIVGSCFGFIGKR